MSVTRTRWKAALLCACVMLAVVARAGEQQGRAETKAPSFSLTTLDGKPLESSDYRGKVVLLDFWATWCVPCQTEVPRFVEFQNKYGKQGFQVIGISMDDSPEPVRKFYAKFRMNYPVAIGTEKVAESYGGVLGLPVTFLIGRDGQIVKKYDGNANLDEMESDLIRLMAAAPKSD
jgi:peroxiredoxin